MTKPRCEDCGRFCKPTDYDSDAKYWTGRIEYRCEPCCQDAWEEQSSRDMSEPPVSLDEQHLAAWQHKRSL